VETRQLDKLPTFLFDSILTKLLFSGYILVTVWLIFTRIRQIEAELIHADGRTDRTYTTKFVDVFLYLGVALKLRPLTRRVNSGARFDSRLRGWVGWWVEPRGTAKIQEKLYSLAIQGECELRTWSRYLMVTRFILRRRAFRLFSPPPAPLSPPVSNAAKLDIIAVMSALDALVSSGTIGIGRPF
jgi:hypothetical protein